MFEELSHARAWLVVALLAAALTAGCSDDPTEWSSPSDEPASDAATPADESFDGLVEIEDGRSLYLRCTGTGSPTIVLEGGDDDTSASYAYAESTLAETTRTCVYDRANLGRSEADERRRGLTELVADLEQVLAGADVPAPYILVGTSGGGYITAGFAVEHPNEVAGMVFVETPPPFPNPPPDLVAATRWDAPENIESRDYLQVEKDAWAARRRIGDIPVTVISNQYDADEIAAVPSAVERQLMRRNVQAQQGWFVLSPRAEQIVVHTGHAVEETDPSLVLDAILTVVAETKAKP